MQVRERKGRGSMYPPLAIDSLGFRIWRLDAHELRGLVAQHFESVFCAGRSEDDVAGFGLDRFTVDGPAHTTGAHDENVIFVMCVQIRAFARLMVIHIDGDTSNMIHSLGVSGVITRVAVSRLV